MANNKWKEYLLKSGLPLEYEVLEFLESKKCISSPEYSYLRPDENFIENEFSFDIDSAYIQGNHFFKLLIECKYRDSSTNWLFLPGKYGGPSELGNTSFLHPNDHFTKSAKFPYKHPELEPIAKPCIKGIELTSQGQNPKTITQAVNQLSYAMAEIIVDDMVHQIDELLATSEIIFYNIPIIVTTANLYRIKENTTIEKIKATDDLFEIATKEDILVLQTKAGKDLQRHSQRIFNEFINERGNNFLNTKLNSFNEDFQFVSQVISSSYCPQSILIVQHTSNNSAFEKLFALLDDIVSPSEKTKNYLSSEKKRLKELFAEFDNLKKRKNNN